MHNNNNAYKLIYLATLQIDKVYYKVYYKHTLCLAVCICNYISSQIATILKENSNLRAALKTVEQMKMEVENEKVAVQDQVRRGGMELERE